MALRGTLEDINIVDLIQYPFSGKRTGEMVIVGKDDEARLYYRKGTLIHGQCNGETGLEVLVRLMDWQQGEFEFRGDVKPEKTTIKGDLHHIVMKALKVRDERKVEEERKRAEEEEMSRLQEQFGASASTDPALFKRLVEFIGENSIVTYACVVAQDGAARAEAGARGQRPEEAPQLQESLTALAGSYPRKPIGRLCLEDDQGVVVMLPLGESILFAVGKQGAPMGAVSRVLAKLVESIEARR